jgi:hypothetical protein
MTTLPLGSITSSAAASPASWPRPALRTWVIKPRSSPRTSAATPAPRRPPPAWFTRPVRTILALTDPRRLKQLRDWGVPVDRRHEIRPDQFFVGTPGRGEWVSVEDGGRRSSNKLERRFAREIKKAVDFFAQTRPSPQRARRTLLADVAEAGLRAGPGLLRRDPLPFPSGRPRVHDLQRQGGPLRGHGENVRPLRRPRPVART